MSAMTTSAWRAMAASRASNTTAAGSASGAWATISESVRWAQIRSWSIAAARNVSAAASTTRRPCARSRAASLPMVVVLPVPLTPTTSTMAGPPSAAGFGVHSSVVALGEQGRQLGPDRGLRADVAALAGALDDVHRELRPDVAGDQDLLDRVPVGAAPRRRTRCAAARRSRSATSPGPARAARARARGGRRRPSRGCSRRPTPTGPPAVRRARPGPAGRGWRSAGRRGRAPARWARE